MIEKRNCKICGKNFKPKRDWSKYCSEKCRKKGKIENAKRHKKIAGFKTIKTVDELKSKEPYKTHHDLIIKALNFMKDQKIRKKDILEYTGLSPDILNRCIRVMRRLGMVEQNSYSLSEKYSFEPLKLWHQEMMMKCSAHNTIHYNNSTIFHPKIPINSLNNDEWYILRSLLENLQDHIEEIALIFRTHGFRKAGDIWKKFTNKVKIPLSFKRYLWLEIIRIHYIASFKFIWICDGRREKRIGEIVPINKEIVMGLRHTGFEMYPGLAKEWQLKFKKLFDNAFLRYFKNEKIPNLDDIAEFMEVLDKTLITRVEAEYFSLMTHSEHLSYFQIIKRSDKKKKRKELCEAFRYNTQEFITNQITASKQYKESFFEKYDFFTGLDEEIRELGYASKQEFYTDLRHLANSFEYPVESIPLTFSTPSS